MIQGLLELATGFVVAYAGILYGRHLERSHRRKLTPHERALDAVDDLQEAILDMPWSRPDHPLYVCAYLDRVREAVGIVEPIHREREVEREVGPT